MDLKNKNFEDIRKVSKSIELKKNILLKYSNIFNEEEIKFITNSTKLREKFDNEIKEQEPNINEYFSNFNAINNILNYYIQMLKENNLYISENMKYKYRLVENEEPTTPDGEETGGSSKEKIEYELVLTPLVVSTDEVVKALEDVNNYGAYTSNLRNTRANVEKAVEDHFGPSQRFEKLKKEKERGKPFPIKTKQAIDTFIRTLSSKPNLLKWEIVGDTLVFSAKSNPSGKVTKNIIKTVMDKAGIDYDLESKESMSESKINEIIDFSLTGKIYDVLVKEVPEVGDKFTKSAFGSFLDNNIK